jgi:hypothetical protein
LDLRIGPPDTLATPERRCIIDPCFFYGATIVLPAVPHQRAPTLSSDAGAMTFVTGRRMNVNRSSCDAYRLDFRSTKSFAHTGVCAA